MTDSSTSHNAIYGFLFVFSLLWAAPANLQADGVSEIATAPDAAVLASSQHSAIAENTIQKLQEIQDRTGRAPSLKTYQEMLLHPAGRLTKQDYSHINAYFICMQRPQLSLEEIRILHAAQTSRMKTLHAAWSVTYRGADSIKTLVPGKFEFWMSTQGEIRYDQTYGEDIAQPIRVNKRFYDGYRETVLESNQQTSHANIHPLVDRSYYFDEQNPLWLAKLMDSSRDLGKDHGGLENFQDRFVYPLEEEILFHRTSCVPLLEGDTIYYLDPKRNYAYCGMEAGGYAFSEEEGKLVETPLRAVHCIERMQDCGAGLWLPVRSVAKRFFSDKLVVETIVDVTRLEVNLPIDPLVFEELIPVGVQVLDGMRRVVYTQGSPDH